MQPQIPSISVVMPVRNGGRYLDAAITSIRNQTFGDFELLVIDDGSTDSTAEMLRSHGRDDPRLRILQTGGAGIVAALNLGIAEARGALIARMDADDIAKADRFALQTAFLEANPQICACGTDVVLIDEDGLEMASPSVIQSGTIGLADLMAGNPFVHPTMMIRREAIIGAGLYRSGCSYAEDYDLWFRLAAQGSLANIPAKSLHFRKHSGQTSSVKRLAQRAAAALARQAAWRRSKGLGEGADLTGSLERAVQDYLQTRHEQPDTLHAFEGKDLLVMARYAQQQAGRQWISGIESRIKRETGLKKAWFLSVWHFLDRKKA